jgi:hypothetical protein
MPTSARFVAYGCLTYLRQRLIVLRRQQVSGDGLKCRAGLHKAPLATVIINGNIGSGYRIGLRLALRRLNGAAGCRVQREPQ